MTPRSLALSVFLTTTALTGMAQAAPEIVRIELGQAGIARYTMVAEPDGNRLSFEVPQSHSDDVLASLIVLDPAGGVVDLQTDTPGSPTAALTESPFRHGMPASAHDLLRALTGERVAVTTERGTVEGRVVSTGQIQVIENDHEVTRQTALLLGSEGVAEIVLTPGTRVTFSETAAERLAAAMDASTNRADTRSFDLTLEADTARTVGLSYVTEAAAWKNSWRLLLDEGRLQGWATLENVSGKDWDDVALTLTTGAPVAYRRELIDPLYIARHPAPSAGPSPVFLKPQMETGGMMSLSIAAGADHERALYAEAAPPAPSGTARAGEVRMSSGILRYALPEPVDLPDGRTANLMYLDMPIEPQIRALYRPSLGSQVLLAASIETEQALAPGLVSVQDRDGFVGDAPFAGMMAGQDTLLPFAAATGADIRSESDYATRLASVVLNEGVLSVDLVNVRTLHYIAELPEQAALFTVEHPRGYGRFDSANGEVEQKDSFIRVTVPVQDGTGEVEVTERRDERRQIALGSRDFAALLLQVRSGEVQARPELVAAFTDAHALVQRHDEIQSRIADLQRQREEAAKEQSRLRQNLEAVQQEALRARYLDALDRTETRIGLIFDELEALRKEAASLDGRFAALFADL